MSNSIPDAILDQAIDWLVKLHSGENTASVSKAITDWRQVDPLHEQAWQALQQTEQQLAQVKRLNGALALQTLTTQAPRYSRRQALKLLALCGLALPVGYWAWKEQSWLSFTADLKTTVGEIQDFKLSDGSKLILNTNTALDITVDDNNRRISLLKGELFVEIAQHHRLAMHILTSHLRLKARDAQIAVRLQGDTTQVYLQQGTALAKRNDQSVIELASPNTYEITAHQVITTNNHRQTPIAWTRKQLVVRQMPLAQLLAELNRYQRGWITYDDSISQLEVSGVFQLAHIEQAYLALANSLPVRYEQVTPFWIRFSAA
ncbi:FecR domain-containing protein [Pseudomonas sp. F1_0610]|uniref:FecR family protein n=1 Tax=Pseudomonas sp. F1_0610 TaxID=3114284 RepID=UPI0039C43B00